MNPAPYRAISLFSGAMGLDLGILATGRFRILACVENNPACVKTIRRNVELGHSEPLNIYATDIRELSADRLLGDLGLKRGELDLLVGGPPCQAFSTAGKRGTVTDPRGTMLWEYLRFVRDLQPKFFVLENVRGLMSAALRHRPIAERPEKGGAPLEPEEMPGSVVRAFCDSLISESEAAYHMDCFEVNAVNYGAPQLRERAVLIGNRFKSQVNFPAPSHGPPDDKLTGLLNLPRLEPWRTLRDAIGDIKESEPTVLDFSPRKKGYLALVPEGSNWRSLPLAIQKESMGRAHVAKGGRSGWWRRLTFDLPCPTLVTMPNHASTSLCHPTEIRALTLREYARIQEFPDQWVFCGTTQEQYAQVGNAVPVRLGSVCGVLMASELDRLKERRWKPYAKRPDAFRVIYIQSHVRTRSWFKGGVTHVWEPDESDHTRPTSKTRSKSHDLCQVG